MRFSIVEEDISDIFKDKVEVEEKSRFWSSPKNAKITFFPPLNLDIPDDKDDISFSLIGSFRPSMIPKYHFIHHNVNA